MSYETTPQEILEANASHAVGRYITNGPSKPYAHMPVSALEAIRSRLDAAPSANFRGVSGWVAIEQAFVIAQSPAMRAEYATDPLFDRAEEAFTDSLDLYDVAADPPDHPWNIKLAMAAIPLYRGWVSQSVPARETIGKFQANVVEIGDKIMNLHQEEGSSWDRDTTKQFAGLGGELATLLAYNRRQKDVPRTELSFGVPSTFRQNVSRQPGSSGNRYDKSRLRGNWDISTVVQQAGRLVLRDKLQVKNILALPGDPNYGKILQDYTEDITVVGIHDHICRGMNMENVWEALAVLTASEVPGVSKSRKAVASKMSRNLYEHIALDRQRREQADGSTLHKYLPPTLASQRRKENRRRTRRDTD